MGTRRRSLGERRARPQGWGRALSAAWKQHGELGSEGVRASSEPPPQLLSAGASAAIRGQQEELLFRFLKEQQERLGQHQHQH